MSSVCVSESPHYSSASRPGRVIFLYYGSIRNAEIADAVLNMLNDSAEVARAIREGRSGTVIPAE